MGVDHVRQNIGDGMSAPAALVGYRQREEEFHRGRWLPGEFVSYRNDHRVPAFHDDADFSNLARTLVAPGYALVGFVNVDWVDRRAQLEVRVLDDGPSPRLEAVLSNALEIGFDEFDLVRVEAWLTPVHYDMAPVLRRLEFELEAVVPAAVRVDGRPVGRQMWARVIRS